MEPEAKQWRDTSYLCGVNSDRNVFVTDRATGPAEPDTSEPSHLYPDGQAIETWERVRPMCHPIAGASRYEFEIEHYTRGAWRRYIRWTSTTSDKPFFPQYADTPYRWRVRAWTTAWGPWSRWARFDFGEVVNPPDTGPPPPDQDPPPPSDEPPREDPPPVEDPPIEEPGLAGIEPADGARVSTADVNLACDDTGAASYEFEIEHEGGSGFRPYFSYTMSEPSVRFWPVVHNTRYRWRVTASSETSAWSHFDFE